MLEPPTTKIPPPVRPQITDNLRRLKRNQSALFANPNSVKAALSRLLRAEFLGKRKYTCKTLSDGFIRVWRLK